MQTGLTNRKSGNLAFRLHDRGKLIGQLSVRTYSFVTLDPTCLLVLRKLGSSTGYTKLPFTKMLPKYTA